MNKFFIFLVLFVSFTTQAKTLDKLLPFLGNPELDVQSYHFNIKIPSIESDEFKIEMDLDVVTLKDAQEIELHTNKKLITVNEAYVNGKKASTNILQGISGKVEYGLTGDVLSIEGIEVHANQLNHVKLIYTVKLNADGMSAGFYSMKNEELSYLLTRNWPYYGRFWFPSNDTPLDAAKVSYKITVPKNYMGIANGFLKDTTRASEFTEYSWVQEMPTTTYNFVFAIGQFERFSEDICFNSQGLDNEKVDCARADTRIPLEIFYNPKNETHVQLVQDLRKDALSVIYYSKLFGKYEFEKLGFLLSDYPFNMESTSLIVLAQRAASVHEIAHHWWGNNVHIPHWGDFWISEGFTTYVAGLYSEFLTGKNDACLDYDSPNALNNPNSTDPNDIFDQVPYCKGAASIHDLREKLAGLTGSQENATKAFLKLLSALYKAHKGKALSTNEFVAFVKANADLVYEKEGLTLDQEKLEEVLKTWSTRWYQLARK